MYQTFVTIVYLSTFLSLIGYLVYWYLRLKQTERDQ